MRPRHKDKKLLKSISGTKCVICGRPSDACHIQTKGSGGDDVQNNLIACCRLHHVEHGQIGWVKFIDKYPRVGELLEEKGWTVQTLFGRTKLMRK